MNLKFQSVLQKGKTKSQKIFWVNSYVWRSYWGKIGRRWLFAPPILNGVTTFAKFTRKHLRSRFFFNRVVDWRPATLLKRKLRQICFSMILLIFLEALILYHTFTNGEADILKEFRCLVESNFTDSFRSRLPELFL